MRIFWNSLCKERDSPRSESPRLITKIFSFSNYSLLIDLVTTVEIVPCMIFFSFDLCVSRDAYRHLR